MQHYLDKLATQMQYLGQEEEANNGTHTHNGLEHYFVDHVVPCQQGCASDSAEQYCH